ncbi:MAG TPA: LptF/LptG family permease [Prolixibacteraceae bacterium]|nr:LptF/LptG family permease [Prolixibacteraceae bacterium]
MLHKIDFYIIKKFLGTFFYAIALIISISIVFDVSENIDDFISKDVPVKAIVFDYYLNFVPYFANLFSGLFTFIAVIYFTSKLAYNTEIIAILCSGVSFSRMMRPYLVSATVIILFSYILGNYVIPPANLKKVEFKNQYIGNKKNLSESNIHRQIEPGVFVYMDEYTGNDVGYKFTIEKFVDRQLVSKLTSDHIKWDRERKIWVVHNYYIRDIEGTTETIRKGVQMDTTLNMVPEDYQVVDNIVETMTLPKLNASIESLKLRGVNTIEYEIEKHKRRASAFSAVVLTIIGVSLASRKVKGGIGLHLGLGLLLSFSYILFMQVTTVFTTSGMLAPWMAMWIPNIVYGGLAFYLYKRAAR